MRTTALRFFSSLKAENSFKFADISVRLASPERLQPKPDVSALQFGKHFTDHMLKIEYHQRAGGWQRPVICPMEYLSLHPAAKVLHYAVELFEGMKAFRGQDGKIRIFRPELNMARMNLSAARSGLPQFDPEELIRCMCRLIAIDQEWVPHSRAASLYLRPTLIGTEPALGVAPPESALLYVILCPVGPYFGTSSTVKPVSLLADPAFIRAWPGGVGDRKMGSNYAPTIKVQETASKKGFQQVLWLYGDDHQITEAGTMNVFVVLRNENGERELVTSPLNGLILPGITRQSILQLSQEWGEFLVTEREITMAELIHLSQEARGPYLISGKGTNVQATVGTYSLHRISSDNGTILVNFATTHDLDIGGTIFRQKPAHKRIWVSTDGTIVYQLLEVFGSGTACVVTPVSSIFFKEQEINIPTVEQPDPVYRKILKALTDIQYGITPHPWARPID